MAYLFCKEVKPRSAASNCGYIAYRPPIMDQNQQNQLIEPIPAGYTLSYLTIEEEHKEKKKKKKTVDHRFSEKWEDSDIVFTVEGEEFHCHYSILKYNSPVFNVMFNSTFKEGMEKSADLPGKEIGPFLLFLNLVYPFTERFEMPKERSVLVKVLDYAEEYQSLSVITQIDHIFAIHFYPYYDIVEDVAVAIQDLRWAEIYGLHETKKLCTKFLGYVDGLTGLEKSVFKELSIESKYDLLVEQLANFVRKYPGQLVSTSSSRQQILFSPDDKHWQLFKHITSEQNK